MSQKSVCSLSKLFVYSFAYTIVFSQGISSRRLHFQDIKVEKLNELKYNEPSNNDEVEAIEKILFNRFSTYHQKKVIHQWKKFQKLKSRNEAISTSCGNITCEYVKDYPEDLIKNVFKKTFKNKGEAVNLDQSDETKGRSLSISPPVMNQLPMDMLRYAYMYGPPRHAQADGNTRKNHHRINIHHHPQGHHLKNCNQRTELIHPVETLNDEYAPTLLVRIWGVYVPKGHKCTAPKCCHDGHTPENYVYYCSTKYNWREMLIFDKNTESIKNESVLITDGCDCTLKREEKDDCPAKY